MTEDVAQTGEKSGEARDKRRGILAVVISACSFATAGVLIKLVPWSALSISAGRSLPAAIFMYVCMRVRGQRLRINVPTLAGAAVDVAMMQMFIMANKLTTAANAIVLQFTEPVWVILLLWLIFGTRPKRADIIACLAVMLGVVCFFFEQLSPEGMLGNILAVASGVAYAGVFLLKKVPGCDFDSAVVLAFLACTVVGIPSLMAETAFTPTILLCILALGVVQVGLGYLFLSIGLDSVSPVAASITSMIEPVLNPILVAIFVGETMSAPALLGAAIILVTTLVYNVWMARRA